MTKRPGSTIPIVAALTAMLAWPIVALGQSSASISAPKIITALRAGDSEQVRTLIRSGADINAAQGDGSTALHWAAYRDDLDAAGLLIGAGADVNTANELGATPLWLAAINGSYFMAGQLLAAGADPNAALKRGETPLMTASRSGNLQKIGRASCRERV